MRSQSQTPRMGKTTSCASPSRLGRSATFLLLMGLALWLAPPVHSACTPVAGGPEARNDEFLVDFESVVMLDVLANDSHPGGIPLYIAEGSAKVVSGGGSVTHDTFDETLFYFRAGISAAPVVISYEVRDAQGRCSGPVLATVYSSLPPGFQFLGIQVNGQQVFPNGTIPVEKLENAGNVPVVLNLANNGNSDLTIFNPGSLLSCAGFVQQSPIADPLLAPGETTQVTLSFQATSVGEHLCPVSVDSSDPEIGLFSFNLLGRVLSVLQPPVAVADTIDVFPPGASFQPSTDLLFDDYDPDGGPVVWVPYPPQGILTDGGGSLLPQGSSASSLISYFPPGQATTDSFQYTISDQDGLTATGTVNVVIHRDAPEAVMDVFCNETSLECSFSAMRTVLPNGKTLSQYTFPENLVSVRWDFGDGTCLALGDPACASLEDLTPTHTFPEKKVYEVTLTVSGDVETRSVVPGQPQLKANIEIQCTPALNCTFDGSDSITPPVAGISYTWSLRQGQAGTFRQWSGISLEEVWSKDLCSFTTPSDLGGIFDCTKTFLVTLSIQSPATNDSDQDSRQVFLLPQDVRAAIGVACEGLRCSLVSESSSPFGIAQNTWSFGDGTPAQATSFSTLEHEFPAAGDFTVSLTVRDGFGSERAVTRSLSLLKASFSVACVERTCTLTQATAGLDADATFQWDFGDGSPAVEGDAESAGVVEHTFPDRGVYGVWLRVTNPTGESSTYFQQITLRNRALDLLLWILD